MTYAKLITETRIDRNPPRSMLDAQGRWVSNPPAELLATVGFYPLTEVPAPTPQEGYHVEPRYALVDSAIVQSWVEVENPPVVHTYRKSYLAQWLYANGFWQAFNQLLSSSADAEFYWSTSTEFDSDHELWPTIFGGIKQGLCLTDEQAEEFLAFGETGGAS